MGFLVELAYGISFSPEELWIAGGWKIIIGEITVFACSEILC